MAPAKEPVLPRRPRRPLWVYGIGVFILLVLAGAILFAVVFRSEEYVAPQKAAPPLVTPPSAPSDGGTI